ncbi:hypothetical protein MIZ01_1706 [Sideroxyarcus emersonii]|uniref:Toxin CptA n=1 Tax=Sideroxyarcus emersonii TaxID=2764705 RepID=A0AAN2BZ70_9PROT|nr:protein YgfX [Sideroxyarcus emersonii]BCK87909.1 hypothetical protein MIZ01_1706 [Sideroxyarcus emersonii]
MQRYFKLRPSRSLALYLFILCAAAILALWQLPLPTSVLLASTLLILCWGGYYLVLSANLRMGRSCVAFRLEEQEGVVLVRRDGRHLSCKMAPDSLVTPYLVILNVVPGERRWRRQLLILPDAIGEESFRRLRVALRWGDKENQAAT